MPLRRTMCTEADRRSELDAAIAEYLDLSRSSLRHGEPEWFALAEQAAWERLQVAAGLASGGGSPMTPASRAPRETSRT